MQFFFATWLLFFFFFFCSIIFSNAIYALLQCRFILCKSSRELDLLELLCNDEAFVSGVWVLQIFPSCRKQQLMTKVPICANVLPSPPINFLVLQNVAPLQAMCRIRYPSHAKLKKRPPKKFDRASTYVNVHTYITYKVIWVSNRTHEVSYLLSTRGSK